jgi:hypothetical protein
MGDHSNRIFWGTVFVLVGILFLARNLGYIDLHNTIRTYWPVFLILIGINIIIKSYSYKKIE